MLVSNVCPFTCSVRHYAAVERAQAALTPWERAGGAKRVVWIIGRQHPGESMASWWMEGFVRRLSAGAGLIHSFTRAPKP